MEWLDRLHIYFVDTGASTSPNNWLYHYQTLISGILALIAGGATVYFIRLQIKSAKDQHAEIIERQYRSTRANLPLALSELSDYAQECLFVLDAAMSGHDEDDDIKVELTAPNLPGAAVRSIAELIALATEDDANKLQAVLQFIQIQHSRLQSQVRDLSPTKSPGAIVIKQNLRHDVLDACILQKMTNYLFPFARWEVECLPDYDNSGLTGALEYLVGTKFDKQTREYVDENLVKFASYHFKSTKLRS